MINRSIAENYLKEVSKVESQLKNYSNESINQKLEGIANQLHQAQLDAHVDSIPSAVYSRLSKQFDPDLNASPKEKYQCQIANEFFPSLENEETKIISNSFIVQVDQLDTEKQRIRHLQDKYLDTVNKLKHALNDIISLDKNAFLKFFQKRADKEKLQDAQEYINENYYHISNIKDDLTDVKQSVECNLQNENMTVSEKYYQSLKQLLEQKQAVGSDYITHYIESDFKSMRKDYPLITEKQINQAIIQAFNGLKNVQIKNMLDTMNIELLGVYLNNKLDLTPLDKINLTKIKQLDNFSEEQLADLTGYSLDELQLILQAKEALINSITNTHYPRINSDHFDHYEEELVRTIYYRQNNLELIKKIEKDYSHIIQTLRDELKYLSSKEQSRYKIELLDYHTKTDIKQREEKVVSTFEKLISIESLLNQLTGISIPSKTELKTYYQTNSASIYAIIDHVTDATQTYTPGDLPSFIVEEVNKVKIDTEGLSSKLTLRNYQEFGAKYSLYNKRILLGDEMGLGKTIQAIAVINHLTNQGKGHALVVAPLSVLANWKREIEKWSNLSVHVYRGNDRTTAYTNWRSNSGVLLTNFEQVAHLLEKTNKQLDFLDISIVDEAHYIKNPNTKRSKNTYLITKFSEYALYMTGTPLENRLTEMKQLMAVLQPNIGKKFDSYAEYENPLQFKQEVSQVYLRRKRDEVLKELPEISYVQHWSDFSPVEQKYYDTAVVKGLAGLMEMRRAGFYGKSEKYSEKIAQLMEIIQEAKENGHKVIIFSFFKIVLHMLQKLLGDKTLGVISGDVSTNERQNMIDRFTDAEVGKVLLSQIDAGGVGLNIQAANIVILCEPQWKPSTENQAIGRVYRMGQTRNVTVYRLLTEESIDETMMELIDYKTDIFNTYAKDSSVADAFNARETSQLQLSDSQMKGKIIEIEKARLAAKEAVN